VRSYLPQSNEIVFNAKRKSTGTRQNKDKRFKATKNHLPGDKWFFVAKRNAMLFLYIPASLDSYHMHFITQ